jgi:gp32 DNA binding protein like
MALDPSLMALVKNAKNKYSRGGNSVKLKEGKTTLRVLQKGSEKFWAELGVHWIKTEKDGKPVAVVGCYDEVHGTPCATCTAIVKASAPGVITSDEELAIVKEWKTKKGVLVCALVRSGSDASEEPQIVELTGTTFSQICSTWETYLADDINILSPGADGIDFVIERSGRGFDTTYRVMTAPKSKPVPAGVLDRLPDLAAHIEKEYFRGDEKKALLAISNMTGINTSGLAIAAPRAPAGLLTSSVVEDAEINELVEEVIAEVVETEVSELAVDDTLNPGETDEERDEREFQELSAKRAAAKALKEAAAKAAAAKAAAEKAKPTETDEEREDREFMELSAKRAAKKAETDAAFLAQKAKSAAAAKTSAAAAPKPATKAAAAASTVSKDDEFGAALPQAEIDSMLADLDNV